ncbi:cytochrome d ubiquinol oxidase subunit II, partial [bacterium]|nr:cytochrome d ubiquinol oxidase subunit II [bacterium]
FWGWSFGIGSLLPAILFGAAIGNILQGLPIASDGSVYISFLSLLNPYALLIGIFSLAMFVMHGAAYLAVKTEGEIQKRAVIWNNRAWMVFVLLYLISVIMSYFNASFLFEGMLSNPLFWIVFLLFLISIIYIPVATNSKKYLSAFFTSCLSISLLIALMGISLFPRLVPSSIDLANSLTIYNASSSGKTLTVMFIIVLIGMPVVIGYTIWIYRIFGGKTSISENNY